MNLKHLDIHTKYSINVFIYIFLLSISVTFQWSGYYTVVITVQLPFDFQKQS